MNKPAIGGYFGSEEYIRGVRSDEGHLQVSDSRHMLLLNKQNAALRLAITASGVQRLWLPRWICPSVIRAAGQLTALSYYEIGPVLLPKLSKQNVNPLTDGIMLVNYYGILDDDISKLTVFWENRGVTTIVDCAHSLFYRGAGENILKSPRKFAGLTDGGIMITSLPELTKYLPQKHYLCPCNAYQRLRDSGQIEAGYELFRAHERMLTNSDDQLMSLDSQAKMKCIDWIFIKRQRSENFTILHRELGDYNEISALGAKTGISPLYYPLKVGEGSRVRNLLRERRIFSPVLWPNIDNSVLTDNERYMTANTLLLPIDHRYSTEHMMLVSNYVHDILG